MTDRPIIFSAPMIRALLDGRKTQTRRVLKKPAALDAIAVFGPKFLTLPGNIDLAGYAPGSRLWVREAFWTCEDCGYCNPVVGANSAGVGDRKCCAACDTMLPKPKTSPIHMPRWASRLTLTVTDVRVQRLQDISEADATAEGVDAVTMADVPRQAAMSRRSDFAGLWNSLHGPAAWDANPWVCAITFDVTRGNIDAPGVTHG